MKQTTIFVIMLFFLTAAIFSCLLPYPIFSDHNNLSSAEILEINNYRETELKDNFSPKAKVLKLEWFSSIDNLLEIGKEYELFDLDSETSFYVKRIGGKAHAEVVASDAQNLEIMHAICENNWSWARRSVLLKLNENTFLPASIALYPHGFDDHFCLHFNGSKTHGTNQEDSEHQKCVKEAKSHLPKLLEQ